jgi:hypothetical protein
MRDLKILIFTLLTFCSISLYSHEDEGELVIIKNTQFRERPSKSAKIIFNLYPTLTIKTKLDSKNIPKGWTKVDSGLCSLTTEHEECNSTIGYIPTDSLTKFDRNLLKDFKLKKQIKFINFNSEPKLNYVFEEDGTFYHYDPICGNGEGKCGKSKLYRIQNIIWGEPLNGDFIYKFFINEKGKICAPYLGINKTFPCSKESVDIKE